MVWFTEYAPPVTETVVAVQFGADSVDPHNRTVVALSGALELPAESLARGLVDCATFKRPLVVSAEAVGLGTTVGVMVAEVVRGVAWLSVI